MEYMDLGTVTSEIKKIPSSYAMDQPKRLYHSVKYDRYELNILEKPFHYFHAISSNRCSNTSNLMAFLQILYDKWQST